LKTNCAQRTQPHAHKRRSQGRGELLHLQLLLKDHAFVDGKLVADLLLTAA
jgi:hypothetical protein